MSISYVVAVSVPPHVVPHGRRDRCAGSGDTLEWTYSPEWTPEATSPIGSVMQCENCWVGFTVHSAYIVG